jgi:UDP-2-acetamido-3-amino-2,3-dideoxy-glucuronate N-acetyltransferase
MRLYQYTAKAPWFFTGIGLQCSKRHKLKFILKSKLKKSMSIFIHPTAEVSDKAIIGDNTKIWHHAQVRPGAKIGVNCIIGKGVYIDTDVPIGNNVKIQNYVSVYHGVNVEDGVFIGPHVCFTNDMRPRAINPDDSPKAASDWVLSETHIKKGAALGANSTIRCGITINEWAMVGSGSVVTRDVPAHGLVFGNPARLHGFVCTCGEKVHCKEKKGKFILAECPSCHQTLEISSKEWEKTR